MRNIIRLRHERAPALSEEASMAAPQLSAAEALEHFRTVNLQIGKLLLPEDADLQSSMLSYLTSQADSWGKQLQIARQTEANQAPEIDIAL